MYIEGTILQGRRLREGALTCFPFKRRSKGNQGNCKISKWKQKQKRRCHVVASVLFLLGRSLGYIPHKKVLFKACLMETRELDDALVGTNNK